MAMYRRWLLASVPLLAASAPYPPQEAVAVIAPGPEPAAGNSPAQGEPCSQCAPEGCEQQCLSVWGHSAGHCYAAGAGASCAVDTPDAQGDQCCSCTGAVCPPDVQQRRDRRRAKRARHARNAAEVAAETFSEEQQQLAMRACTNHATEFTGKCRCYSLPEGQQAVEPTCSAPYRLGQCVYTNASNWVNGVLECASARGLARSPKSDLGAVDVVVSHCSVDVSWLSSLEHALRDSFAYPQTFVYTKCGSPPLTVPENAIVQKLPNYGRCDHTFAHHIVERYNSLSDTLIFVKDTSFEYPDYGFGQLSLRPTDAIPELLTRQGGFVCGREPCRGADAGRCKKHFTADIYGSPWHIVSELKGFGLQNFKHGSYVTNYDQSQVSTTDFASRANITMGEWWNETFSAELAEQLHGSLVLPVCYGGTFGVTDARRALHRIRRDDWAAMRDSLTRGDNILEGHFAERSWMALLTPPLDGPIAQELHLAGGWLRRARPALVMDEWRAYRGEILTTRPDQPWDPSSAELTTDIEQ